MEKNGAFFLMLIALVAIVGMFVYFMSTQGNKPSTIQISPSPQQISLPEPAKPGAQ